MRFAFLGSAGSWYLRDLQRAAGNQHCFVPVSFEQLEAWIPGGESPVAAEGQSLGRFDAVLVRSMPPGSLEQVVFRMNALARLFGGGTRVVNPPRSLEIAIDKYLALARLADLGLAIPRTYCCQNWQSAMAAFERLGGRVVVKPLFGGEGRGIMRLDDPELALRAFKALEQIRAVIYLQEYIENEGVDLRLLTVGEEVFGMRRVAQGDWRTNISQGGLAESYSFSTDEEKLAVRVATSIGCPLCAVDLLPGIDGKLYALEVNAVPGWRALTRISGADISATVVNYLQTLAEAPRRR